MSGQQVVPLRVYHVCYQLLICSVSIMFTLLQGCRRSFIFKGKGDFSVVVVLLYLIYFVKYLPQYPYWLRG